MEAATGVCERGGFGWARNMKSVPLAAAFNPRDNALNLLRLALASMVIFGHAASLGGYELPQPFHLLLLEVAVDGSSDSADF